MRTLPIHTGAAAAMPLPLDTLSPRERDVLRGLTHGLSDLQIAHELCLYETTVKNHVGPPSENANDPNPGGEVLGRQRS